MIIIFFLCIFNLIYAAIAYVLHHLLSPYTDPWIFPKTHKFCQNVLLDGIDCIEKTNKLIIFHVH